MHGLLYAAALFFAETAIKPACLDPVQFLGAEEEVLFVQHGMRVSGRVDTGAGRSSLHATDINLQTEDNHHYVEFNALDDEGHLYKMKEKLRYVSAITNTSGVAEKRYVIRTHIVLKNKKYAVDVNLKDRSNMQYKFLIGRDLIKQGQYLVKVDS